MTKPYWRLLRQALTTLEEAAGAAEAALSPELRHQYTLLRRSQQLVSLWHYLASLHPECEALQVLALVQEVRGQIQNLEIDKAAAAHAPDLRLGRMRTTP